MRMKILRFMVLTAIFVAVSAFGPFAVRAQQGAVPDGPLPYKGMRVEWYPNGNPGAFTRTGVITKVIDAVNGIVQIRCDSEALDHMLGAKPNDWAIPGTPMPFFGPCPGCPIQAMIFTSAPVAGQPIPDHIFYSVVRPVSQYFSMSQPPGIYWYKAAVGGGSWITINVPWGPKTAGASYVRWDYLKCPQDTTGHLLIC